jgi:purine-binding chemotaxis protein CheW
LQEVEFDAPDLSDVERLLQQLNQHNTQLDIDAAIEETPQIDDTEQLTVKDTLESVDKELEVQDWELPTSAPELQTEPIEIEEVPEATVDNVEASTEWNPEPEVEASPIDVWQSTQRDEEFQVLYFEVNSMTFAVPLDELGGIHKMGELSHLIGRPDWYLGLNTNRDSQYDVVDTARWVMADKLVDDSYKSAYEYIVMLGQSAWGLASSSLKGTEALAPSMVNWRETAGKRPWLAGMVKEKMCALVHVAELIKMLEAGLDVQAVNQ